MTAARPGPSSRPYKRDRAATLAESDLCLWCGHHGATQCDHVVPRALGGPDARWNYAPIHGGDQPCTQCPAELWTSPAGRACNQQKGDRPPADVYRSRNW